MSLAQILRAYKNTGDLHHAYLVVGDVDVGMSEVRDLIGTLATITNNPDITFEQYERFGINDSRSLRARQNLKSFTGGKKFFVVGMQSITNEASNALLKTLEEPSPNTHIFMVCHSEYIFPATVISRCVIIHVAQASRDAQTYNKFLSSLPEERLSTINGVLSGDFPRDEARRFLDGLEMALSARKDKTTVVEAFKYLSTAKKYLGDTASLPKLILEHLALVLPK